MCYQRILYEFGCKCYVVQIPPGIPFRPVKCQSARLVMGVQSILDLSVVDEHADVLLRVLFDFVGLESVGTFILDPLIQTGKPEWDF